MDIILTIIISALCGYICYKIAKNKGRDKVLALFMGLLFGVGAIIVYALISPSKEVQKKRIRELLAEDYNRYEKED